MWESVSVADPGFLKGGGQSTPLGGSGGMLHPEKFEFQGLLRSYLVHSG